MKARCDREHGMVPALCQCKQLCIWTFRRSVSLGLLNNSWTETRAQGTDLHDSLEQALHLLEPAEVCWPCVSHASVPGNCSILEMCQGYSVYRSVAFTLSGEVSALFAAAIIYAAQDKVLHTSESLL